MHMNNYMANVRSPKRRMNWLGSQIKRFGNKCKTAKQAALFTAYLSYLSLICIFAYLHKKQTWIAYLRK